MKLIGVKFDTCDEENAEYTAHSVEECRDEIDLQIFERIMRDRETEIVTQGHTFATPIWADEIWDGHEKIVVYANNGRWRLVEIVDEQYGDIAYWKDTPFRIRMNKSGEDWNEYKTLADALKDYARIDDLYRGAK